MSTTNTIRAVQTCRRKVDGLDDDTAWRDLLERVTGLRSLRAMTGPQMGRVIDELHRLGAPVVPGTTATNHRVGGNAQTRKIRALWAALAAAGVVRNPADAAICTYAARQLNRQVDDLEWLTAAERIRLIESLKKWAARKGVAHE